MANDFDQFPTYDPITKSNGMLSDTWVTSITTFYENLVGYLLSTGMLVPQLTTDQRDALQSPQTGQMIYNTTVDAPQIFQAGAWKTFTTT